MFGWFNRRKKKKNNNPDVPKSKPYQPRNNVNQSHLESWTTAGILDGVNQKSNTSEDIRNTKVTSDNTTDFSTSSNTGSSDGGSFSGGGDF